MVFENADFAKYSVSHRQERQIQGSRPSKNDEKSIKNAIKSNMEKNVAEIDFFIDFTLKRRPKITPKSQFYIFAKGSFFGEVFSAIRGTGPT